MRPARSPAPPKSNRSIHTGDNKLHSATPSPAAASTSWPVPVPGSPRSATSPTAPIPSPSRRIATRRVLSLPVILLFRGILTPINRRSSIVGNVAHRRGYEPPSSSQQIIWTTEPTEIAPTRSRYSPTPTSKSLQRRTLKTKLAMATAAPQTPVATCAIRVRPLDIDGLRGKNETLDHSIDFQLRRTGTRHWVPNQFYQRHSWGDHAAVRQRAKLWGTDAVVVAPPD